MIKTVPPHDLRAACESCGIELCDLATGTGLSEETLLGFARGEVGLSAEDRLGIILLLEEREHALPDEWAPWRKNFASDARSLAQRARASHSRKALDALCEELREEIRQEREGGETLL